MAKKKAQERDEQTETAETPVPHVQTIEVDKAQLQQILHQNEEMKRIVSALSGIALAFGKMLGGRIPKSRQDLMFALPSILGKVTRHPELIDQLEAGFVVCLEILPDYLDEPTLQQFNQTFKTV